MRAYMTVEGTSFNNRLDILFDNVMHGTKKAANECCDEIMALSLAQVPRDTGALAGSIFKDVQRRGDIVGYSYEGVVGYGQNSAFNTKSNAAVSDYMMQIHEDMSAVHTTGKAKFLEDPFREYGFTRFMNKYYDCMKESLRPFGG